MTEPRKELDPARKAMYYTGMGVMAVGLIIFISNFFFIASGPPHHSTKEFFANPHEVMDQDSDAASGFMTGMIVRGVIGMVLIAGGGVLMGIGRSGMAGSGILLDPTQARQDLEPWNRARGGMISDTISEIPAVETMLKDTEKREEQPPPLPVVKVRCTACRALNDEGAKFCGQCGKAI